MRLKHRVDDLGVLWFENPVVTVRRVFVRAIGYLGLSAAFASAIALLLFPDTVPVLVLQALLALAIICIPWWAIRRRRSMYPTGALSQVGFTPTELLLPDDRGSTKRIRWSDFESAVISRDDNLSGRLTLQGPGMTRTIRGLNLDIALKVRWARMLASRGSFDPRVLTESPPGFDLTEKPMDGTVVAGATPEVRLRADEMIVWKGARGIAVPRRDVDAVWFPLFGKDRLIVAGRGHQLAVILEPDATHPLLTWLFGDATREESRQS